MSFQTMFCRICHEEHQVPDNAVKISQGKRGMYSMLQWDGKTHDVRIPFDNHTFASTSRHTRWHVNRKIKKPGCLFCFPPEQPKQATSQEELLDTVLEITEEVT